MLICDGWLFVVADMNLGEDGMKSLGPCLAPLSNMTSLNLEGLWYAVDSLCRAASQCGCFVMIDNGFGAQGAWALGPSLAQLANLRLLNLSCTESCAVQKRGVGGWVTCFGCWVLVSDNDIGHEGVEALGPCLARLPKLTVLNLNGTKAPVHSPFMTMMTSVHFQ